MEEKLEIALSVLDRNDSAIRFSEAKTGFLFVLMGLLIDQFTERTVDSISTCPALPIIFWLSVIHTIYSAVLVVFPRLAINGNASILYFSDVAKTDLRNFTSSFGKLKKADLLNHVLSQAHATATIATIKFIHVRRMLIGILVQTGLLLLLVILEAI